MNNPLVIQKKVCVIGDEAVGKTSLVRRFIYELFDDHYLSTMGVKVSRKTLKMTQTDREITLQLLLWDIAGAEGFNSLKRRYYQGAAGAVVVCDMTRLSTLRNLLAHITTFRALNSRAKLVLVANKNDLHAEAQFTIAELGELAARYGFSYFSSSAKMGDNVELLFYRLGELLLQE